MGFLSALLGSSKGGGTDGAWMRGERDGEWKELDFKDDKTEWSLSTLSCFLHSSGLCFCILRFKLDSGRVCYMGCEVVTGGFKVLITRSEDKSGKTLVPDEWSDEVLIDTDYTQSAAAIARNCAAFNDYSSAPPYVLQLLSRIRN